MHTGDVLPEQTYTVTRADLVRYAGASGDRNPIHWSERVATSVGLPGVIAHGMFTMGHLAAFVSRWAGGPDRICRLTSQFRAPVYMGDSIVAGGRVKAVDEERGVAVLECWVSVERDGTTEWPIKRGEAEVLLDP